MAKHKMAYAISALVLAVGMLPLLNSGDTFASWRGGENENGNYEMYIEVGDQAPVDKIGIDEPDGTVSVEKIISDEYADVISYDANESGCIPHGDKVGKGVITCNYLDEDGEVIQSESITVHVFKDPKNNLEDDWKIESNLMVGQSIRLIDYVAGYFDNPEEIMVGFFDEGEDEAVTITGETVADAVITAKEDGADIGAGTIYFYNQFSDGSYDELAQLDIWVYEEPKLEDLTMSVYGVDEDKSRVYEIESDGNLPWYALESSDESVVSVEGSSHDGYILKANGVGQATMTVTYEAYGNLTQTFAVTVDEYNAVSYDKVVMGEPLDASLMDEVYLDGFLEKAAGGTVLGYYDVTVAVKDKQSGDTVDVIEEVDSAVRVELSFPEDMDLPEVADGYTRVFYVIRDHGGEKDILSAYDNGDGTFHFYSDKFSTYALAYYDVADELAEYVTTTTGTTTAAPETGTVTREGGSAMAASLVTAIAVAVIGSAMGVAMLMRRR